MRAPHKVQCSYIGPHQNRLPAVRPETWPILDATVAPIVTFEATSNARVPSQDLCSRNRAGSGSGEYNGVPKEELGTWVP